MAQKCMQQENEAHMPRDESSVAVPSAVWGGLRGKGTTVLAATMGDTPTLFVVPEPRYCYWPTDVEKVQVGFGFSFGNNPSLGVTMEYWSPPLMETKRFEIDSTDCLRTGTYFHRFVTAASRSSIVNVCFEGDDNKEFSISCKIGFFTRRKLRKVLKSIQS